MIKFELHVYLQSVRKFNIKCVTNISTKFEISKNRGRIQEMWEEYFLNMTFSNKYLYCPKILSFSCNCLRFYYKCIIMLLYSLDQPKSP